MNVTDIIVSPAHTCDDESGEVVRVRGGYWAHDGVNSWPVVLYLDEDGEVRADCSCNDEEHCLHSIAVVAEHIREYAQD